MEFLLENLKQLLLYNANLIFDIKSQVEYLYNDLTLFKAFLKDSTEKRSKHETLKELVKQIRNVVYDAEDAIDTFVAHAAVHKARKHIGKAIHMFDYSAKLRVVAKQILVIREKVKDIYENKKFGFEALGDGSGRVAKEKKVNFDFSYCKKIQSFCVLMILISYGTFLVGCWFVLIRLL